MDWPKILEDLREAGWTQAEIAERCGVAQPTVSDLQRGESKAPSFTFGVALMALHKKVVRRRPSAETAQ